MMRWLWLLGLAGCSIPPISYGRKCTQTSDCPIDYRCQPIATDATEAICLPVSSVSAPATAMISWPDALTVETNATFSFTCDLAACGFRCQLDDGEWASCVSPASYAALGDGNHSFGVTAGSGDAWDPTPPLVTWQIDSQPPDTSITEAPTSPTSAVTASFAFACDEPSCVFECALDNSTFVDCTSPRVYSGLFESRAYVFEVRASDAAGNIDPSPAAHAWTVE